MQRTDEANRVIVIPTTHATLDLALNCRCSLINLGIEDYIFHALDSQALERLHHLGFPVLMHRTKDHENIAETAAKLGEHHRALYVIFAPAALDALQLNIKMAKKIF